MKSGRRGRQGELVLSRQKWVSTNSLSISMAPQGRDHKPDSHRVISYLLETAKANEAKGAGSHHYLLLFVLCFRDEWYVREDEEIAKSRQASSGSWEEKVTLAAAHLSSLGEKRGEAEGTLNPSLPSTWASLQNRCNI